MPPSVIVPQGYLLERLDPHLHSREDFGCGNLTLDTYLRAQASQAQERNLSATHVMVCDLNDAARPWPIVGYVTLSSGSIPLEKLPPDIAQRNRMPNLPSLLLARMGVDLNHQNKKLGRCLIQHTFSTAWEMNQRSGCLIVLVDAKDQDSKARYVRYGFTVFPDRSMSLFVLVKNLA